MPIKKVKTTKMKSDLEGEMFTIEKKPPPPIRGTSEAIRALHEKLKRTLEVVKVGEAFIIHKSNKSATNKYLKVMHKNEKFRYFIISDNVNFVRIYRVGK